MTFTQFVFFYIGIIATSVFFGYIFTYIVKPTVDMKLGYMDFWTFISATLSIYLILRNILHTNNL